MARTEGQWHKKIGYITPNDDLPILLQNDYLNFGGTIAGDLGYGIRDNNGVIDVKNEAGTWQPIGTGLGGVSVSFETVSKNLNANDAVLNYTGENLTSIVYVGGITKTLNYTGENLTSVVLSGTTPSGIDLTKTLSYDISGNLTGVAYS